jgi:hypothetical protein
VLILALVYIISISLVVGALASWAMNDLNNTTVFKSVSQLHYSATSVTNVAIQSIRYYPIPTSVPTGASAPAPCWAPTAAPSVVSPPVDNFNVAVWCSTVESLNNLLPGLYTRIVTFYACLYSAEPSGAQCKSNPLLTAVVGYDDYPAGRSAHLNQQCNQGVQGVGQCGSSAALLNWVWGTLQTSSAAAATFTSQPTNINAGSGNTAAVTFLDSSNNPVVDDSVTISLATGAPGNFDPSSTLTATTNSSGTATFTNLVLDTGGSYTLTAADGSVSVNSAPFTVTNGTQTVSFGSGAPTNALVNSTYTPTATATSGLTASINIDSTSSTICSISGGVVTFNAAGTCLIDATQLGNSYYSAATQVRQSIKAVSLSGSPLATGSETTGSTTVVTSSAVSAASGTTMLILVSTEDNSSNTSCTSAAAGTALTISSTHINNTSWYSTGSNYYGMCAFTATATGGTSVVTVTLNQGTNYATIQIITISGDASASIGVTGTNSGSGTSPIFSLSTSPSVSTGEILFGDLTTNAIGTQPAWSNSLPVGFPQVASLGGGANSTKFNSGIFLGPSIQTVTDSGGIAATAQWGTIGIEIKP